LARLLSITIRSGSRFAALIYRFLTRSGLPDKRVSAFLGHDGNEAGNILIIFHNQNTAYRHSASMDSPRL
jgi:hypothetical protein